MQMIAWFSVAVSYLLLVGSNVLNSLGSTHEVWTQAYWGLFLLLSLSIAFLLFLVFTSSKSSPPVKINGKYLTVLFVLQIFFQIASWTSLLLIVQILTFGNLIIVACVATWKNPIISNPAPKVQRLAKAGLGALFVQIIFGEGIRVHQLGLACPSFPGCLESFFPVPFTSGTFLTFTHRWWGVLMLGLFIHLAVASAKMMPQLARSTRHLLALSVAQIFLGVGTVLSSLEAGSRAMHAAVGYALWGILFYVATRAGGLNRFWKK